MVDIFSIFILTCKQCKKEFKSVKKSTKYCYYCRKGYTSYNMSNTKSTNPVRRIKNPVTGTYYKLRVKSTSAGRRGTIIGKWSSKSASN